MNQIPKHYIIMHNFKSPNDIFFISLITTLTKKVLVIYALNPKNYTNYIMQNRKIKNIGKNLESKI